MPRSDTIPGTLSSTIRVARASASLPVLVAVAFALSAASCKRSDAPAAAAGDIARYHDKTFHVARVVDADTIDIAVPDGDEPTTRVRLWGVDAPEMGHHRAADAYYATESTAFAERTLAGRDVHVMLVPNPTRGHFGRLLAYLYLQSGGPLFNEMLIEQGYAYADPRFDHPYCERFMAIEQAARDARRGLWAAVTVEQMPKWRRQSERPSAKPVPP